MFFRRLIALFVFVLLAAAAHSQGIVINEIMYNPTTPEPEWIELYNPSDSSLSLTKWIVTNSRKKIILSNITITGRGYLILTSDTIAFKTARNKFSGNVLQIAFSSFTKTSGHVVIRNASAITIDSVHYSSTWGGTGGKSLERKDWMAPSLSKQNWGTSLDSSGATPGRINSIDVGDYDASLDSLVVNYAPSSGIRLRISNVGRYTLQNVSVQVIDELGFINSNFTVSKLGHAEHLDTVFALQLPNQTDQLTAIVHAMGDAHPANDTLRVPLVRTSSPGSVVINELMFNPNSSEPQWVELFNSTSDTVEIAHWKFGSLKSTHPIDSSQSVRIAPKNFVILTSNDSILRTVRTRDALNTHLIQTNLTGLTKSGGILILRDDRDRAIDSILYDGAWLKASGYSLERYDVRAPATTVSDWHTSQDSLGATMGRVNSTARKSIDCALREISATIDSNHDLRIRSVIVNIGTDTVSSVPLSLTSPDFPFSFDTVISSSIRPLDSIVFITIVRNPPFGALSLIVVCNTPGDKDPTNDTLHLDVGAPIPHDSLVINEIMYAPATGSSEWIEVFNRSTRGISLKNARLDIGCDSRPVSFIVPPIYIPSHDFGLIAASNNLLGIFHSLATSKQIAYLNRSSLDLKTDSACISISNNDSLLIDSLHYTDNWQLPQDRGKGGISLERIKTDALTNDSTNWSSCTDGNGGTPLRPNSARHQTNISPGTALIAVSAAPNPFSPDGDGFEDQLMFTIQVPSDQLYSGRCRIFDQTGRMVRSLFDGLSIVVVANPIFDGKNDHGSLLGPGLYTCLVEISSKDQSFQKKLGIVIAGNRK